MSMVRVQWMCIHARSTDIPSLVAADHVHVELRAPNGALHNHFCDACKSLLKLDCLARWLAALSIHILHANATTLYRWPLAWCLPRPSAKRYNIYFSIRLLLYSYKTLSFVLRSYYTWIRDAFLFFSKQVLLHALSQIMISFLAANTTKTFSTFFIIS